MKDIELKKPTPDYIEDIKKFRQEILDNNDIDSFAGCFRLEKYTEVEDWITAVTLSEDEKTCGKDSVPSNVYLAVRITDNKIVGIIDFRHHINHPILGTWGGHIGYSVRPDERNKGYAREMLRLNLINCKNRGLERVLVTCSTINIQSEKTILSNGGIFDKEINVDGDVIKRYWIPLL